MAQLRTAGGRIARRAAHPRSERVLREAAFLLMGRLTPIVAIDGPGGRYFLDSRDMGQGRLVYMHGNRDVEDLRRALAVLAAAGIGDGTLSDRDFLDVGANVGTTTIPALTLFSARRAHAFEPSRDNARLLRHAVVENGVADRCEVHEMAVSDAAGEVRLALSGFNYGDHRIVDEDAGPGDRESYAVRATTLDAFADQGALDPQRVGLAWVDVQGHEAHVLAGATRLLEAKVPFHVEYWPDGLAAAGGAERFHALVSEHFRTAVDLRTLGPPDAAPVSVPSNGLRELDPELAGDRYTNLVLLP